MDWILSPWPPVLTIWAIALISRIFHRSWFAPSVAAALLWSCYCTLAVWTLEDDIRTRGMWVIACFMFSLCAGGFLAGRIVKKECEYCDETLLRSIRDMHWFLVTSSILAFTGICYYAIYGLRAFGLTFDLSGLLQVGAGWSATRYVTGEPEPLAARLLFTWLYPASVAGGMLFAVCEGPWRKALSLSPILLAVLISLVEATRAGIMFSTCCWFGAYYSVRVALQRANSRLFTRSFVLRAVTFCLLGVVLFKIVDVLRGGVSEDKQVDTSFNKDRFAKYAVGSIPGFTQWYQHYFLETPSFGAWTFAGPFNLVGLKSREAGVFTDLIILSDGEDLNLYTCFRGMILDFTVPGLMLILLLGGFGIQRAYLHLGQGNPFSIVIIAASYSFIAVSPITSIFCYNGLVLAFGSTLAVFHFAMRKREKA